MIPSAPAQPPKLAPHPATVRPGIGGVFFAIVFLAMLAALAWFVLRGASLSVYLRLGDPPTTLEQKR